ncbi:MAG: phosphoglucosamine mutase, partial [Albidovulum sp.]
HTATAAEAVVLHGADLGICLDGDADRVMILDENGHVADGDQIMALLAGRWADAGMLRGGALVATVMSNLGLERFLTGRDLRLERTSVGDRYVVEKMRAGGFNLGGEQSGHIVMTDFATTGDGLIAGLQFLAAMADTGKRASQLARQFETVPQMLRNVRYGAGKEPLKVAAVQAAITGGEARLNGTGRLLIRKSGTEPMIRVMAECEDEVLLGEVVGDIVAAVEAAV